MIDASGETSDLLSLQILEEKNGKLIVKISASAEWLAEKNRTYPVTVDPSVMQSQTSSSLQCKFAFTADSEDVPSSKYTNKNWTYVGHNATMGDIVSLYYFEALPTMSNGDYITGAIFGLEGSFQETDPYTFQIDAYECYDNSFVLEDNCGFHLEEFEHQYEIIDYCDSDADVYEWDITNLVRKWYESGIDSLNNTGFLLKPTVCFDSTLRFATSSHSTTSLRPVLMISYVNHSGVENYLSYTTKDLGDGTAYINNASGNLTVELPIVSTVGENMPASLALYYNGTQAGVNASGKVGYGWRTNYDVRIDEVTNQSLKNLGYDYTYTDPDGTVLYLQEIDTNKYIDEVGAGLIVTVETYGFTMTDKEENKIIFDTEGKPIRQESATSLSNISFTYDSNKRLVTITDGSGDSITLNRNTNGFITSVADTYGRKITLTYSSNKLASVTHLDGTKTKFTYTSEAFLKSVVSSLDLKTEFDYWSSETSNVWKHRVNQITAYSMADDNAGRESAEIVSLLYTLDGFTQISDNSARYTNLTFDQLGREIGSSSDTGVRQMIIQKTKAVQTVMLTIKLRLQPQL